MNSLFLKETLYEAEQLLFSAEQCGGVGLAPEDYLDSLLEDEDSGNLPFTLVPLIRLYRGAFPLEVQARLDALALALGRQARETCRTRHFYDPLPYLEALVTLRLLAPEDDATVFEDAAQEWLFREWGWGAHLCDQTSHHLLCALTLLLLLDPEPPYPAARLLHRLLRLDDSFSGLPRIPATRALLGPPPRSFREALANPEPRDAFLGLLKRLGAEALLPPLYLPPDTRLTPCFGGAMATTHTALGGALGTLSRFPLMPTLSLAQQEGAYPALFWQDGLNLGFLKWRVQLGMSWLELPGTNSIPLSSPIPTTYALQRTGEALVLRLYAPPATATRIEDRWETRGATPLAVRCLPLAPGLLATDQLAVAEGNLPTVFATLWAFSLEGELRHSAQVHLAHGIPSVPRREGEEALDIDWELPGDLWQVRIDPLAKEPLTFR